MNINLFEECLASSCHLEKLFSAPISEKKVIQFFVIIIYGLPLNTFLDRSSFQSVR